MNSRIKKAKHYADIREALVDLGTEIELTGTLNSREPLEQALRNLKSRIDTYFREETPDEQ